MVSEPQQVKAIMGDAPGAGRAGGRCQMQTKNWFAGLEIEGGEIIVKKTCARIPVNAAVLTEALHWLTYYAAIKAWRLGRALRGGHRLKVAFSPERPRPWYLVWPVLQACGARIVAQPEQADIIFHFDDSTISQPGALAHCARNGEPVQLNFDCADISKSRVANAFEESFGYPLALDPRTGGGAIVEKSEENGVHDGRVVHRPLEPRCGRVYQKLIDNQIRDGVVADLRTPTIGGKPVCVFIKERPLSRRFSNHNTRVSLHAAETIFSPAEISALTRFSNALNLDWGGLDVLRDRTEGRLYVVDANKTDMGPPILLPLRQKLRATRWLSDAFKAFAQTKRSTR